MAQSRVAMRFNRGERHGDQRALWRLRRSAMSERRRKKKRAIKNKAAEIEQQRRKSREEGFKDLGFTG